ncbi:MAG TPA: RsmG family class I SAM-dependent methyltransferase [Candidatus Polarisedimenticolaceae bacterium]|nr:RsmG family class I SAM-dependent methyltransferase [Candidatus Polarisedimenticolaceae bacterium]
MTEEAVEARAAAAGIVLPGGASRRIVAHARLVLESAPMLHLTTITDEATFLERHIGESFEGAALVDTSAAGTLVDLGSGNGYPGIPMALARPHLRPVLVESSHRKADFLRRALQAAALDGVVLDRRVQRSTDLDEVGPIEMLVTRAAEGWEAVVPRLAPAIRPGGLVLIWAGESASAIVTRASWRRFELVRSHALPGRKTKIYALHRI